jgi:hypothetical protein
MRRRKMMMTTKKRTRKRRKKKKKKKTMTDLQIDAQELKRLWWIVSVLRKVDLP